MAHYVGGYALCSCRQPHVSSGDNAADSPLLTAAHSKDLALLRWFVRQRVDVNAAVSEDDPFTALHSAVSTRVEMYEQALLSLSLSLSLSLCQ